MSHLPEPLHPWREPLEHLSEVAMTAVGPMMGRLAALVGPMLHRPRRGSELPDGVAGLAQRGPWERLLISEWALAEVAPLEFLRRATSGEQLFRELAHVSNRAGRRCLVLVDSGPEQFGCPRIVQLALLVVLARRAATAGATLWWTPLQHRGPWHEAWSSTGPTALFASRTLANPSDADLDDRLPGTDLAPGDEVWIVGGRAAQTLRHPNARRVEVWEAATSGEEVLGITLRSPGSGERKVRLPRPSPQLCKRIFAVPNTSQGRHRQTVAPRERFLESPLQPGFRFSHEGARLVGRCEDGTIVGVRAWADGGTGRDRMPKRMVLPTDHDLVALGWHSGRPMAVSCADRRMQLAGGSLYHRTDVDSPPVRTDVISDLVHINSKEAASNVGEVWFTIGGWLHRWRYTEERPLMDVAQLGLALGRRDGRLLTVVAEDRATRITLFRPSSTQAAARQRLEGVADLAFIGPSQRSSLGGLVAVRLRLAWLILGSDDPPHAEPTVIDGADLYRVVGVSWYGHGPRRVTCLVVLDTAGALWLVDTDGRRRVPTEGSVRWACASAGIRPCVAWMEADSSRVVVYDLDRQLALLTVHTKGG